VQRLEEARLVVAEERIEAELRLGGHAALIGELRELVDEHPMREWLSAQLLVALYRAGRQAEALATYSRIGSRLVEELGIEPGPELQRLQRQILTADPDLDLVPPPAAVRVTVAAAAGPERSPPRQLPTDIATFTGRSAEVDQLLASVGAAGPVVISAIGGMGGIGKSALAIHVAHRLADRFPDGQLYVNLQGSTASLPPMEPLEVLGRFLRSLGVDARQIPSQVDEAAARFRSLVADRRLLVVLDNARDAGQVAPLLPGSPGGAVLVTSRRVLASLDGARFLHLDVLSRGEAVALLGRLAGQRRVAAEPRAAEDVALRCGRFPLALRVAAARLAARPAWPVRALADRLADERRRLDELELADLGIRASLELSLLELSASPDPVDRAAAAAFPLLGLPDPTSACRWSRGCSTAPSPNPNGCWTGWWTHSWSRARRPAGTGSTTCSACTPGTTPPASTPPRTGPQRWTAASASTSGRPGTRTRCCAPPTIAWSGCRPNGRGTGCGSGSSPMRWSGWRRSAPTWSPPPGRPPRAIASGRR
jgi:hypothetical protein